MPRNPEVIVLEALVRLSGPSCVADVDMIAEVPSHLRPQVVGKAIAQHGKTDPMVRAVARGINLPDMLARASEMRTPTEEEDNA